MYIKTRKIVQYRVTDRPSKYFVENQLNGFVWELEDSGSYGKMYIIHDNDLCFKYINYRHICLFDVIFKKVKTSIKAPNMNCYASEIYTKYT